MHGFGHKAAIALAKGLMLASLAVPATVPAAEDVEPLIVRIESIDVPAQEIHADGVDYSLSGRATVTLSQGPRLTLRDLQPGMQVKLGLAKAGSTVVNSVVVLPD
ncbi:MAG: hypothetical protein KJ049_06830 [Gammaproteobacteria bacterium]|jgi:hypothetical protein|nr:hypothetical protein [Gammaproteobacteria bacterium]